MRKFTLWIALAILFGVTLAFMQPLDASLTTNSGVGTQISDHPATQNGFEGVGISSDKGPFDSGTLLSARKKAPKKKGPTKKKATKK